MIKKNIKAQAQIITTVLIILLVLAAIVIVWQVISGTVNEGAEQIDTQSGCIGTIIEIVSADVNGQKMTITRKSGGSSDAIEYAVLVNGVVKNSTSATLDILKQLESSDLVFAVNTFTATSKLEVSAKIGDTSCGTVEFDGTIVDTSL